MKTNIINFSLPTVMGILNVTEDSFYDGGKYQSEKYWLQRTEEMISQGASIIDIGAESTRPGAKKVEVKDEINKLLPVIKSIKKRFPDVVISIDTYHSQTAKACVETGADMINDISGGSIDENMLATIAALKVPYILMHIKGTPQDMQKNPQYHHLIQEVNDFFTDKIQRLNELGFDDIILDPGFGFGKTVQHNYQLMNQLEFFTAQKHPVLVGISRKSMINKVLDCLPKDALNGTTVLHTISLLKGAKILRVHDVKEAMETIKIVEQLKRSDEQ